MHSMALIRTKRVVILVTLFVTTAIHANETGKCDLKDLQRCNSCGALERAVNLKQPDIGEYYRGAYWNGLYAAYRLNCQKVAIKLLDNNANPNLGGSSGSMLVSISGAWPHNNKEINKQWMDMLFKYKVDATWKSSITNMTAKEIVEQELEIIDYPDIWNAVVNRTIQGEK